MIKKETLEFLKDLEKNNNKEWFVKNKKVYQAAKQDFTEFYEEVIQEVAVFDPDVGRDINKAKKVFRINRDARFSKDKTPYKINFGGVITPNGWKSGFSSYYIHIQPGESGVAGGMHMLESNNLFAVRKYISSHFEEFLKIINEKSFKKYFGNILERNESLKTPPRGFDKEDKAIEYLKLKSYSVWSPLSDEFTTSKDFYNYTISAFKELQNLNKFLDKAI